MWTKEVGSRDWSLAGLSGARIQIRLMDSKYQAQGRGDTSVDEPGGASSGPSSEVDNVQVNHVAISLNLTVLMQEEENSAEEKAIPEVSYLLMEMSKGQVQ
ncbi:hypothetical protein Y1Q_0020457 [Alligator mississippiensis]|uniref:Uncharacterized protein n=1 Tax=Alligator mississippiensis TaxID=8496 RepID=A0A151P1K1_ALLMI|nr:hypothetical protein Y1Q_0020457 [Alligator mississippiensis]